MRAVAGSAEAWLSEGEPYFVSCPSGMSSCSALLRARHLRTRWSELQLMWCLQAAARLPFGLPSRIAGAERGYGWHEAPVRPLRGGIINVGEWRQCWW